MSTINFDLTGDAYLKLDRIMAALGDTTPVMTTIGRVMVTKIQFTFRNSKSPWGIPWAPLKSRNGKPLIDTRRLLSSITYNAGNGFVTIGTNVEYGPYHHFGFTRKVAEHSKEVYFLRAKDGTVGNRFVSPGKSNFAQTVLVKAHEITVPSRPFLPITQDEVVNLPDAWANDSLQAVITYFEGQI